MGRRNMWSTNGGETQPRGGLHPDQLDQAAGPRGGKVRWTTGGTPAGRMSQRPISGSSAGAEGRKREPIMELPSVSE